MSCLGIVDSPISAVDVNDSWFVGGAPKITVVRCVPGVRDRDGFAQFSLALFHSERNGKRLMGIEEVKLHVKGVMAKRSAIDEPAHRFDGFLSEVIAILRFLREGRAVGLGHPSSRRVCGGRAILHLEDNFTGIFLRLYVHPALIGSERYLNPTLFRLGSRILKTLKMCGVAYFPLVRQPGV
jgi:hypothetical protein